MHFWDGWTNNLIIHRCQAFSLRIFPLLSFIHVYRPPKVKVAQPQPRPLVHVFIFPAVNGGISNHIPLALALFAEYPNWDGMAITIGHICAFMGYSAGIIGSNGMTTGCWFDICCILLPGFLGLRSQDICRIFWKKQWLKPPAKKVGHFCCYPLVNWHSYGKWPVYGWLSNYLSMMVIFSTPC